MPNTRTMYTSTFLSRKIFKDRFSDFESFRSSISNKQFSSRGEFRKLISQDLKGQIYIYGPLLESLHNAAVGFGVRDNDYLDLRALTRIKELYSDFMNLSKTISKCEIVSPVLAKRKLTTKYLFMILMHRYLKAHYVVGLPDLPKNLRQVYADTIIMLNDRIKDKQNER